MLTDIFARRYENYPIWTQYTESEARLLQQCIGIAKDVLPYYSSEGKVREDQAEKWRSIHDRLARELGLRELWQKYFSSTSKSWQGVEYTSTHTNTWVGMCDMFVTFKYLPQVHGSVDHYMKERLSLIELVFRQRNNEINELNRTLEQRVAQAVVKSKMQPPRGVLRLPGDPEEGLRSWNAMFNQEFTAFVNELNVRFQQAKMPLTYHNGFIQVAKDEQVEKQIGKPFWDVIAAPLWLNVATDMNEAIDRRDNAAGDAAWYASRALESSIKVISDVKGWTTGKEKGAHNYIDNLVSQANGRYIEPFEMEVLKSYFTHVRNMFGHGPGIEPMPKLSVEQTDWTIEFAMSWVRTLVRRM